MSRPHVVLAPVLLAACSVITDFSPESLLEQTEELCSDGVDNDGNGAVDCADTSCRQFDFCQEDTEARCADGRDNDADGLTDCQDPGCCTQPRCSGEPSCGERTASACSDGVDNDDNGLTDCADFSCQVPVCCTRLVPLIAETFSSANMSCTPPDCSQSAEDCCDELQASCNHFDPGRWIAWGSPPPRQDSGQFSPNQPCASCPASGLLSVQGTLLSPDLVLEFEADLGGKPEAMISVGLVEDAVIPAGEATCGGVYNVFPLLAGVTLSGPQVLTEVAGVVRGAQTDAPVDTGTHRVRLMVESDGTIAFFVDSHRLETTSVRVEQPYRWVRVLVQGHSTTARLDNLFLARRNGCSTPAIWTAGAHGPGPVLVPGGKSSFDGAGMDAPSVLLTGSTYVLYYTGHSTDTDARIGYTTSPDGQSWSAPGQPLTIHGENAKHLSDPTAFMRGDQDFLMVYRTGATASDSTIALAQSVDGITWNRTKTILKPGASGSWDDGDISGPALVEFRHRFYLWYTGTSASGASPPAIGLATAKEDLIFTRSTTNPVLRPRTPGLSDRGVSDPWVMRDGQVLHMWYVGHSWGGKTGLAYAVSEDGQNWVDFPGNPVIGAGAPGIFGSARVGGPTILDRWGTLQMWYGGADPASLTAIGHAVNTGAR